MPDRSNDDVYDEIVTLKRMLRGNRGTVNNTMSGGTVHGAVIQAGTVSGGVTVNNSESASGGRSGSPGSRPATGGPAVPVTPQHVRTMQQATRVAAA
ncbi:hypothetical protein [Streptomyces sp. NPDC014995]|uniref:hypothetical protein n=1 Tax=Streptomyces sp. NPDC014995 TaxID=3364936 RepID=UPI0036FF3D07